MDRDNLAASKVGAHHFGTGPLAGTCPPVGGYDLNLAPPNHLLLSAWARYRYNISWISDFVLYLVDGKR
jgi:hypothetical protein